MTEMEQRYSNFMNAIRTLATQGKKVVPSNVCKEHKVLTTTFNGLVELGYVKIMDDAKQGKRKIIWIPTTEVKKTDVDKVYQFVKDSQSKAKRNSVANGQKRVNKPKAIIITPEQIKTKLSRAQVTINGTQIVVPVYKDQINLELGNNKIRIDL